MKKDSRIKQWSYLVRTWQNYWFRPYPLLDLAVCRIIIVAYQWLYLIFQNYYGVIVEYTKLSDVFYEPLPIFRLLTLPFGWDYRPSLVVLVIIFGLTLITGLTSLVGYKTRVSLIMFAYGNIFIQTYLYSFGDYHHPHAIMLIALAVLAFSPAGEVLSIDSWKKYSERRRRGRKLDISLIFSDVLHRKSRLAAWPLLLTQWMFALTYLSAAFSKLKSGLDWLNGWTLQYHFLRTGWLVDHHIAFWFSQHHLLAILSSWISVLFELTFFLVLIFPRLIWLYIPLGIAFHIGIYIAMSPNFFQNIALYSVFIPWTILIDKIFSKFNLFASTAIHARLLQIL